MAWGDYDNDGDLDLYLANATSPSKLFRNETQNVFNWNWLKVKLVGTVSNRAGIGARVRVVAGGVSRIREISGGSGYCSQDAMIASFGLGASVTVDSVVVRWPSGIVQAVTSPAVRQQITMVEAPTVDVPGAADVGLASALERTSPNPFTSATRIDFAVSRGGPVSVTIFRVTGQRVANVLDRALPAGRHPFTWDGRDAGNRPVPNGVYFVRVESPDLRATRRIVKLQ